MLFLFITFKTHPDFAVTDAVDRMSTVRMPWHDIGCVVFNKSASDVARHFIQRWNHAKKVKESTKANHKYPLLLPRSTSSSYRRLPPFIKDLCELVNCQVRHYFIQILYKSTLVYTILNLHLSYARTPSYTSVRNW